MGGLHGFRQSWLAILPLLYALFLSLAAPTSAQPALLQFSDCFSSSNTSARVSISAVYAQYFHESPKGPYLNFTVIGDTPLQIIGSSGGANPVATTLFTTPEILTFQQPNNNGNSFFCATVRPASPLPTPEGEDGFCPIGPGPLAFATSISVDENNELATFNTRIRALDPFQTELLCLDVNTTLLDPGPLGSVYGHAHIVFWATVGLAIAYWAIVGLARLVAAWGRGSSSRGGDGFWDRVESAGFILASALSGEHFASSPALMRYCTPSLRDIVFHTQWCAAMAMVAVQWPMFIYPILSQTAWASLSFNVTLIHGQDVPRWNPLSVPPYEPPSNFADQLNDPGSSLFIDSTIPNRLFQLPANATQGINSFAWAVGVRPQDLFGICMKLFLGILAGAVALSALLWFLDVLISSLRGLVHGPGATSAATFRSPRYSSTSKDLLDGMPAAQPGDENRSLNSHFLLSSRFTGPRPWWRWQSNFGLFHGSVMHGNLLRILVLFHFPVTIFSCYQMSLATTLASRTSVILAALSFAFFSVLIPALLVLRLTFTRTSKLYDETWTLLSLGPLYNHYRHGSQLFACLLFAVNIAFGITIGFGQKSGTAQAIIILVIEVAAALGTSILLPWGQGASMGLISFLFCVGRIVIAVLLVILTPVVSIGAGPAQWVAYAILFILGMIYLAFLLMLAVKVFEGLLRIFGGVGFNRSRHVVDSGLLGTMGLMGCCGSRSRRTRGNVYRAREKQPSTLMLTRPTPPFKPSTPSNSAPPSVLRPEHAMQPYKEDSDDDENGFIMAAWHKAADERTGTPEPPKSGFARVGGGRAHYESPYAITSGSTSASVDTALHRHQASSSLPRMSSPSEHRVTPTPSISGAHSLPPGAMPPIAPTHVRKKSQTAIIETAPPFAMAAPPVFAEADQGAEDVPAMADAPAKKSHWYNLRKIRRMSESDVPASPPAEGGRSFVVVRKQRPGVAPQSSSAAAAASALQADPERRKRQSFSVLRGGNRSDSNSPAP